jgi:hypothetical protein
VRDSVAKRVRKLLHLTQSSNEHEAARARERASALMEKHGLTDDDVADVVQEVVDSQIDEYRVFLAVLSSELHGCDAATNKRGRVALRGQPEGVRRAAAFYRSAVEAFDRSRMPPIAPWLAEVALEMWTFFWWDGFAAAVYDRRPEVRPGATSSAGVQGGTAAASPLPESDIVEEVRSAMRQLSASIDVEWFKIEARRSGWAVGECVSLDPGGVGRALSAREDN